MSWIRWLLLCAGLLAVVALPQTLCAQNGAGDKSGKDYRPLPLDGGAEALKKRLLEGGINDELVDKIVQELRKNPEKRKELEAALIDKSKSPAVKPGKGDQAKADKQVEELLKKAGADPKQMDADQRAKFKQTLEKILQENNKPEFHPPVDPNDPKAPRVKTDPVVPKEAQPPPPPKVDPLAKAVENGVKAIEKGPAGPYVKHQEAWQQFKSKSQGGSGKKSSYSDALKNALGNMEHKSGGSKVALPPGEWLAKLSGGGDQAANAPQGGSAGNLGSAGNTSTPPSLGLSGPDVGNGALVFVQFLVILLVVAAIAVGVWRLLSRIRWRDVQDALHHSVRPLPPGEVASRAQLIQAFEHLALVVLGPGARTTNHRDIADSLGATPERTEAADELATLYERARYDPVEGELPAADLATARRDLRLLAGMAASSTTTG